MSGILKKCFDFRRQCKILAFVLVLVMSCNFLCPPPKKVYGFAVVVVLGVTITAEMVVAVINILAMSGIYFASKSEAYEAAMTYIRSMTKEQLEDLADACKGAVRHIENSTTKAKGYLIDKACALGVSALLKAVNKGGNLNVEVAPATCTVESLIAHVVRLSELPEYNVVHVNGFDYSYRGLRDNIVNRPAQGMVYCSLYRIHYVVKPDCSGRYEYAESDTFYVLFSSVSFEDAERHIDAYGNIKPVNRAGFGSAFPSDFNGRAERIGRFIFSEVEADSSVLIDNLRFLLKNNDNIFDNDNYINDFSTTVADKGLITDVFEGTEAVVVPETFPVETAGTDVIVDPAGYDVVGDVVADFPIGDVDVPSGDVVIPDADIAVPDVPVIGGETAVDGFLGGFWDKLLDVLKWFAGLITGGYTISRVIGLLSSILKALDFTALAEAVEALPTTLSNTLVGTGELDFTGFKTTSGALVGVFPFCIPFDLANVFIALRGSPKCPVISIDLSGVKGVPGDFSFEIDISESDISYIFALLRKLELITFILGLIVVTRNLIRG